MSDALEAARRLIAAYEGACLDYVAKDELLVARALLSLAQGRDEFASPRDAPSDELVEAVAESHYHKTIEVVSIIRPGGAFMRWEDLPEEQRRVAMAGARAAIEAYQNITGGDTRGEANTNSLPSKEGGVKS
jgi:hypothetical protein